jgi:rhodanese-related sulfurtransferase
MKKYLLIALSILFIACNAQTNMQLNAIEFESALTKDSTIQLLDVRTSEEFKSGHLKNALWADWNNDQEFERRIGFINKNNPVYVYCLSGGRSASAAAALRKKGYKNVMELKGGINAWRSNNKTVIGESNENNMTIEAYDIAVKKDSIVLVDFGAPWCPPCKTMEPILQDLLKKYNQVHLLKVDGGKDLNILKKYAVTALPVFIVYKNGKEIWRKDGVCTLQELEKVIL